MIAIVILISAVSIIVILSYSILFNTNDKETCGSSDVHTGYLINITSPDDGSYMLIVPIPVYEDGSPAQVVNNLKLTKGDADFRVVHESYGWVMKIYGKGNVTIDGDACYFHEPVFPSIINSSGPPLNNTEYSWEEKIPRYWNSSVYSNKSIYISIIYSSYKSFGCYKGKGVIWGTFKWITSENKLVNYVHIEKSGWAMISLNVNSLLR